MRRQGEGGGSKKVDLEETSFMDHPQEKFPVAATIFSLFIFFDLGFQISNPVIKYQPEPSCMSHMELAQICPERTTLSPHSPGSKGC